MTDADAAAAVAFAWIVGVGAVWIFYETVIPWNDRRRERRREAAIRAWTWPERD